MKHMSKETFYKLYPVMQAMKCIEDGRRELQEASGRVTGDTTIPISTMDLLDD